MFSRSQIVLVLWWWKKKEVYGRLKLLIWSIIMSYALETGINYFLVTSIWHKWKKGLIKTLNDNNILTRKMVSILSYLKCGLTALPMKKKDISNYRTRLNREVKGSDMTQVLDYFRKKQTEDPSFFYKFDLDEERE